MQRLCLGLIRPAFLVASLTFGFHGTTHGEDLIFQLQSHPSAVAIQFDVETTAGTVDLESPVYLGTSPHTAESATLLSSGAVRHVVYTTTGLPISSEGKVKVQLTSPDPLEEVAITLSNVLASNADGVSVPASPTGVPLLSEPSSRHVSIEVGQNGVLSAPRVVDLDGSVASILFLVDGAPVASAGGNPPTSSYTPLSSRTDPVVLLATDNTGAEAELPVGTVRSYLQSEVSSFQAFQNIHFGGEADPGETGLSDDPLGAGLKNGPAYLLGINPNAPDRNKLPEFFREEGPGGPEFVFRFTRIAIPAGINWDIMQTGTFAGWDPVDEAFISEVPGEAGFVDVEVRITPDDLPENEQLFLSLETW